MTSHLDNARKELTAQRKVLAHDIHCMERQLKKIDAALAHLAPTDRKAITRNQPNKQERDRRWDVLKAYHLDMVKQPLVASREFDMDDFLDHTGEPQELRKAFDSLIRHSSDQFERIKTGLYRAI